MHKSIYMFALALLLAACTPQASQKGTTDMISRYKGYESPAYTISKQEGKIEIRDYKPHLVAEVTVPGDRDKAVNAGFRILAGYIFGGNESKSKIAMTSPVTQSPQTQSEKIAMTSPVTQTQKDGGWIVQFSMPSEYALATLPTAKDNRIQFRETKPVRMVAVQFSGFWTDSNMERHKKILEDYIVREKIKTDGEYVFAYYDDPFTLPFNRRNEIMVRVAD
jgi:hypothetical protein